MNKTLNKLKIATKIGGGFGILIFMLLVISIVGWRGLTGIYDGFVEYRGLARDTNLAGRLQANMLMVRMNVKDFIITQSDKDLNEYKEYYEKMGTFLSEAKQEIQNPKRAALIREYATNVEDYNQAFYEVVDLYRERDRLLKEVLNVLGPKSEKNLTSIMASAKEDGDAEAAFEAGIALRHLLLGRFYAQKYLDTNRMEDHDRVDFEFEEANKALVSLGKVLENPERVKLNNDVLQMSVEYLDAFDQQADAISIRNELIVNTLDALGPVMAKAVEDVKLSVKSDQDALGPVVQAHAASGKNVMIVVSLIAIAIAVFAGIVISGAIVKPVKMVSGFVDRLAKGDFTAQIVTESQDEVGVMVRSLNGMAEELREGFVFIKDGVSNMASSTTELSAISTQLAGNAEQSSSVSNNVATSTEQTSHNMTTVASSVEQMSMNLQSVATASEEMTATIEEIAKNTDRGRTVTQTAVSRVNETSEQVNQLGQAANLIGNITDTIKGISEQTNLLALNATIEAASAGEAGKGFAVVANEIKDLSRQTAQATEQISQSIDNIQSTTKVSISNISGIVDVIGEIDEITAMIASAVEEQSNTTSEIAANVSQTADGVKEVARNVNQVNEVTTEVARDVNQVNQAAVEIAAASNQLSASSTELSEFAEKLDAMASHYQV